MRRLGPVILLFCGCASTEAAAPPAVEAPPPAIACEEAPYAGVRCGIDDSPFRSSGAGESKAHVSVAEDAPPWATSAIGALPLDRCAPLARGTDEGKWFLHVTYRADGSMDHGRALDSKHFSSFARCVMELMCAAPPVTAAAAQKIDIPLRVALPGLPRRIEVAIDPEGGQVSDFDLQLVRGGARDAAEECGRGFSVPSSAMVSTLVTLNTSRSLSNLRRETRASAETSGVRDTDPEVGACIQKRLAGLVWGDKNHPNGERKLRVVVRWGEDTDETFARQRR